MAASMLRSTVGLTLRRTAPTPASSRLSSSAPANTRRTMHTGAGRRGYSGSPIGEWEWMDACFAAPAAAGALAFGYLWWVVLPEKKRSMVKMSKEQAMICGWIQDASGVEQSSTPNM